jgi:hypothetical protein
MVAALRSTLGPEAKAVFDRMVEAGIASFDAVTAAGKASWITIAGGLSDDLLPRALGVFQQLVSLGVTGAEAISAAFSQAFNFSFPGGGAGISPTGQWFVGESGKFVFGTTDAAGHFVPLGGAPPLSAADQAALLASSGPRIPGFEFGGIVPGPIGLPQIATVHGGETIIPHSREGMREFATLVAQAISRSGRGPQVIVVPVVDRDQLPAALYRLERERRWVQATGTTQVAGIRGSAGR